MAQWQTGNWEQALLTMAHQGSQGLHNERPLRTVESDLLERAYTHCETMTAWHSRSFSLASRLLPYPKRRAVRALYAFCRTTDDLVDHPTDNTPEELCNWWHDSLTPKPARYNLVALAWGDTRSRYAIPQRYAEQLLEGVANDLRKLRYESFAELACYCYGVASTVGLMSMHIIGFKSEEAIPYAVKLGVALQLTNILRDVAEDWERGRLYIPKDELQAFGVNEQDIAEGRLTANWRNLMRYQVERTRQLYSEALPGIALLNAEGRLAILAAADFYRGILSNIERHNYDVFSRRAHLTKWGKIRRLPSLWWQSRTYYTGYAGVS